MKRNLELKRLSDGCPFCEIASGKASASIVYENGNVLAFMDLNPVNVGHTLVVPRGHWENIHEIPEAILAEVIAAVKRVSDAVKKTVGANGIKVIQLNGRAAGQVVFHLHFHVIPIVCATGKAVVQHGRIMSERRKLDETAQKIRKNL